ncbi:outer membrane beta-barrel protein [Ekhidna sp.]|uniref:outer membrane beta-barrel protein n=1 Tax=Ekhidna sp. TaxID=2608089 RepID=UPI003BACCB51
MRNLLAFTLLLSSIIASAQIKEGAKVVDLSLSYSNANGSDFFFIQPLIGFGTSENEVVYAGISYSHQKNDFGGGTNKSNFTSFIIGYEQFIELNPKVYFSPFISGSYGFGKSEGSGTESDQNGFSFSLRPRLHYFMNSKWSVVASVGVIQYTRQVAKNAFGESTSDVFSMNLNSTNVFFGIRLNLNN